MKKILVMMATILALSAASLAAAEEETASQPVVEQPAAETTTPEAIAPGAVEGQSAVEPVVPPETAEPAKRPPIREHFNAENTEEFGGFLSRAMDYEKAYAEQGKNLSPWTITIDVLNEKNIFGWRKTPLRRAFPPFGAIAIAPRVGWNEFNAAANIKTPEGWVMTMVPRDTKLAGFHKILITADQQDIVSAEIE